MGTGNSFGKLFKISTWGESHGGGVGVTLDGVPPKIPITREEIQKELDRRRPGQSRLTTPRNEDDQVEILSGVSPDGLTLGTPIGMLVRNKDHRSQDYDTNAIAYRPSHADATYDAKYGIRAVAGGGRSSARETIGRVAAGAVAKKMLALYCGCDILGYVKRDIEATVDADAVTLAEVEANIARCPDAAAPSAWWPASTRCASPGTASAAWWRWRPATCPRAWARPCSTSWRPSWPRPACRLPGGQGVRGGLRVRGTLLTGKEHNDEVPPGRERQRRKTKTNRSGRHPGRDQQWGDHRGEGGVQAHVHHRPAPEHRDPGRHRGGAPREGPPRPLRAPPRRAHGGGHGGAHAGGRADAALRPGQHAGPRAGRGAHQPPGQEAGGRRLPGGGQQ
ncbi:unnamed protein product, partial [Heterosigma akashiwo]